MSKKRNIILIIDDTPENLRVLGEFLEADGHEVRVATNGAQGLEIARGGEVELVLLDIMMAGMDGYEVCRQLKKRKSTRDLPVIFLTALDSVEDEVKGLALGAVDYISKPFKLELVRSRVNNQLALANAQVELRRHNLALEDLVLERSRDLAEAHLRLLTIDSAKYDFLQLIYQELWAPGSGIIEFARRILAGLPGSTPAERQLKRDFEASQNRLFESINNALLMAGTHSGDRASAAPPVKLAEVFRKALAKVEDPRTEKSVSFDGEVPGSLVVAGDLDLIFQALATVVHAAVLLAPGGALITVSTREDGSRIELTLGLPPPEDPSADADLESLFSLDTRFHPSPVGETLGLAVPLAAKILKALGGAIRLSRDGSGTLNLRVDFLRYERKAGAKIRL